MLQINNKRGDYWEAWSRIFYSSSLVKFLDPASRPRHACLGLRALRLSTPSSRVKNTVTKQFLFFSLFLGDYWELNPDKELHKLVCYRYTIATIFPKYSSYCNERGVREHVCVCIASESKLQKRVLVLALLGGHVFRNRAVTAKD